MQYQQGDYEVLGAKPLGGAAVGVAAAEVPAELRARLFGRRFTRQELEAMGVDFRGDRAIVHHGGTDWELELAPNL
jgi:hypothetical protein